MVGEEKWSGRRNGWGGVAIAEAKCWEGGVVVEEEWLGRKSGWGRGVVGDEEWLGRRSGQRGGVVGEEEWLGTTDAFTHVLHAVLARTHARPSFTHAFSTNART